jgi:hypothetical protein
MKRCVIHIGMHKTGSTSLQYSFWNALNNNQWKYSTATRLDSRTLLQGIFNNSAEANNTDEQLTLINTLIEDIEQSPENYLLSTEWLCSTQANTESLLKLKTILSSHVDAINIVGYVRSPKSYMESMFQQRLKDGLSKFNLKGLYPKYRQRLQKFDVVFGEQQVNFWKFDPSQFINHCVVHDFCHRLAIDFEPEEITRKNDGLSREAVALVYTYHKYTPTAYQPKSIKEPRLLTNYLMQLKGSKLRFATQMVQPILDANRADIEWIEKRLGASLTEPYENSEDAIYSEDDLLRYKPETLLWLAQQLGDDYVEACNPQMTPQQVAQWMALLHKKLLANIEIANKKIANKRVIKLKELVQQATQNNPALENLSTEQAIMLVENIFEQINQRTNSIDDGSLTIAGLGKFHIKSNQQKPLTKKRMVFHSSHPKKNEN